GESGADLPDVLQSLIARNAQQQRADRAGPAALTRTPATDHHFLHGDVLDLDPVPGAASRRVTRLESLGQHAFQALLLAGGDRTGAVALEHRRRLPRRAGQLELVQQLAPARVRHVE